MTLREERDAMRAGGAPKTASALHAAAFASRMADLEKAADLRRLAASGRRTARDYATRAEAMDSAAVELETRCRMNRDEVLTELARRHPESADLIAIVRKTSRTGRPSAKPMDFDAREQAAMKIVRAVLAKTGVASRNELLRAMQHVADAEALSAAVFNLELSNEIRSETSVGPKGGRPQTLYQIV